MPSHPSFSSTDADATRVPSAPTRRSPAGAGAPGAGAPGGGDTPRDGHDAKERVREATDIVDLVGSYLALRRTGKTLVARCPWHDDSRPSLSVNPERQTFRCWVCNIGGDAFSFLMRMERLEFREALEMLAQRAGIALGRGDDQRSGERALLRGALEWAAGRYASCLADAPEAAAARAYLLERGLSAATITRFGVGFAPAGWDWLLRQAAAAGHSVEILEQAGLVIARGERPGHYDRFRERVMFPIRDPQGRCIAFGGRVLPGSSADVAKYINSPETPLFSKSGTLYGLDSAREAIARSGRTVVVEGYMDCLAARQAGHGDVVAVLGTAVGQRHARLLRRHADRIVLVLDGDAAGRRRADEVMDLLLTEPVDLRIARLPSGSDPCDLVMSDGGSALGEVVDAAVDALDYRLDTSLERLGDRPADHAIIAAVESVLTPLARVSADGPLTDGQRRLREDRVLGRLSRRFGLDTAGLRHRLEELRGGARAAADRRDPDAPPDRDEDPVPALTPWDREVLELVLALPDGSGLVGRLGADDLDSPTGRHLLSVAARCCAGDGRVALHRLLDAIDDERLRGVLVGLDEDAAARPLPPAERLVHWEESWRRRRADHLTRASVNVLKSATLDAGAETELLERLVAERRAAEGMSEPKEG